MRQRAIRRSPEEQYELIMECRNSGMTDAQWCQEHDINISTFYNWISRLRQRSSGISLPDSSQSAYGCVTPAQDVVKLNIIDDAVPVLDEPARPVIKSGTACQQSAPIEIVIGAAAIRFTNDVDPRLLAQFIQKLGEALC